MRRVEYIYDHSPAIVNKKILNFDSLDLPDALVCRVVVGKEVEVVLS